MGRLFALTALVLSLSGGAGAQSPDRLMTLTGTGSVTVAPDTATLTLGVERRFQTATEAVEEVSRATANIIRSLKIAGLSDRDLRTRNFSVQPVYADRKDEGFQFRTIVSYRAVNEVSATVRDLDTLGGVLDTVLSDGANRIGGITFGVSDRTEALTRARAQAVRDAMIKAETYASAAGITLGPIHTISEVSRGPRPVPAFEARAMAADAAVPIEPGSSTISVTVTMQWALQ